MTATKLRRFTLLVALIGFYTSAKDTQISMLPFVAYRLIIALYRFLYLQQYAKGNDL
ncbi:hypothetical protein [Olivibacter jilunii]|uniref:hypothetical protein n=1 Tax=Olivibacter jilunii TaxID=985016 RepID=UPI003F15CF67